MDALKFTECMQVIVKGKEHWGIPEHYCCVRGPCRSHQCWWPQTRSRYWNDRTSPSWSAQRPASPFWLSYERPQTLRGGQEQIHEIITALERCCKPASLPLSLSFNPGLCRYSVISPSLVSWNLSLTLSSFSMAFMLGALILCRILCCSFRRCCSVFVSALISSSDSASFRKSNRILHVLSVLHKRILTINVISML